MCDESVFCGFGMCWRSSERERKRMHVVELRECVCRRVGVQQNMYKGKRLLSLHEREEHNVVCVCKKEELEYARVEYSGNASDAAEALIGFC